MKNEIKTSRKFFFLIFIMSSFLVVIGLISIWKINKINQTIQTSYADRLLPMDELADVRYLYAAGILTTAQQANLQQISFSEARKKIQQAQDDIATNWKKYLLTSLTKEEKQLVYETAILMGRADKKFEKLKLILKEEDSSALDNFITDELFPSVNPTVLKITDLLNLQVKVGKNAYKSNLEFYNESSRQLSILIVIALVFGIPFSYYLLRKIKNTVVSFNESNEKLATVELNYSNLIKNAGDSILILNENTQIIDSNDQACQLLGYSHEELLQMKISDLITPSELDKQKADIEYIRKNKGLLIYRKIKRKDGTELDAEINNRLMEGKGFFAILRDITERKKAELAIKESEEKYRYLFDHNPAFNFIWDIETLEVLEVNDAVIEKYGYTREEWKNKSLLELRRAEDYDKIKTFAKSMLEDEMPLTKGVWLHLKKNGEEMHVEISSHRMMYNNRKVVLALAVDITDKLKAERELKEREKKYRYLFDNNPAYIIIWDLETLEVLEVNNAVYEKYGYGKEEWMNMSVTQIRPEEDCQKIKDFAKMMLNSNETIQKRAWRHVKKNGQIMLMDIASHRIDYNNRKAILSLGRDVTEQVKAEAELAERETQLKLFVHHSPASLAMFDNDLRYIIASSRWLSDYKLGEQNIIGKTHYEVFPEIEQDWKEIHQRCLNGAIEKKEEDSFVRIDGSKEWLRWEIHPWHKATREIGGIIMFSEVITERKNVSEMFKNQFENSPDTILYINKDLKIEAINRNVLEISKEELIGMDCILILPEESRQMARAAVKKCFETGLNQEIENALSDSTWVRSRIVPLFIDGSVAKIIIFSTDITEQRKAEEKLLQSEEMHRALTENISDAIVLLNEKFELIYQSPSAERISGFCFEESRYKSIFNFMHPDDFKMAEAFLNKALNSHGIPMQNQFRIIHKEGYIIWIEGTVLNLLENKNIGALIVNYRDITNRKTLEEQRTLTASIVNSSDDAIISKNIDGIITSWNFGAEKILGYTVAETIGKHISMLVPLGFRDEEINILDQVRKGHSIDHYETQRMKKNGEIIHVSLTISPIKDVMGNVVGASKIMRDISESKKIEAELIRFNTDLKKTNTELDRFVYSASHDLRAPLKSMLGLIHITRESIDPENVELYERLTMLDDSVIKLDNFIENILNYSKNTRMESNLEEINFEKLLREIKESHEFMDITKELNFKVEVNSKGKFVSDNRRLNIIINNIVSNAIKYRDISKKISFVNISINYDKTKAIITVEDNGIGISDKEKEKVFDMFYRATPLSSGSGLGLYIVKETIEKLGGKINVESELNKGTKFIVEITNQVNILN